MRTRGNALNKERDQLAEFRPGTPDYDNLERSLADKAAKLQVDMQLKKKEFLEREGKVYFQVYDEVTKTIREYAEMNQIDLVLRYSGDPIDPKDRQSVLQGVNRAIVYELNLDITREDSRPLEPRAGLGPASSGASARGRDSAPLRDRARTTE